MFNLKFKLCSRCHDHNCIISFLCALKTQRNEGITLSLLSSSSAPLRLHQVYFDAPTCKGGNPERLFLVGDYSSSAEFFVTIAVFSFLYSMAGLSVYCFILEKYRENNKGPQIVSPLLPRYFLAASLLLPQYFLATSSLLPRCFLLLPRYFLATSLLLPCCFLLLPHCFLATSLLLPRYFLAASLLLPRNFLAASSLLPRYFLATSPLLPPYFLPISSLLPRYFLAASLLLPRCLVATSSLLPGIARP